MAIRIRCMLGIVLKLDGARNALVTMKRDRTLFVRSSSGQDSRRTLSFLLKELIQTLRTFAFEYRA